MKKASLFFIIIVLSVCFCSCRSTTGSTTVPVSKDNLDISITDVTDSSSLIGVEINCSQIHSSPSHDKNPMGERSFTFGSLSFDGSPVEGPFGYVIRRGYNTYDEYAYMDKKTGAFFDVDIAGSLGLYMHSDDGSWENIVLDYMDDERAVTIAKEFAGSFRDITRYEVSAIKENSPKIKTVYFQKRVNGILTTDRFQVDVSYDAIVLGYSSYMTDKIPVEIRTDDINIEEIDIEVSNYLKDILESNNIAEINKAITMLSLLEDGKRIIIEQYDMRVGDDGHSECIELMIVID